MVDYLLFFRTSICSFLPYKHNITCLFQIIIVLVGAEAPEAVGESAGRAQAVRAQAQEEGARVQGTNEGR